MRQHAISNVLNWINFIDRFFYFFNYLLSDAQFCSEMQIFLFFQVLDFLFYSSNRLFIVISSFTIKFFHPHNYLHCGSTVRKHNLNLSQCLLSSQLYCFRELIHPKSYIRGNLFFAFLNVVIFLRILLQRCEFQITVWSN